MYCESAVMFYPTPKMLLPALPETTQLTEAEVRLEQARRLAMELGVPTRVRGARVEVLLGDVWAVAH